MIVNIETRDVINKYMQPTKQLVVSYVNKDGDIVPLQYNIPVECLFEWEYAHHNGEYVDGILSWDNKRVMRAPMRKGGLSKYRIREIIKDIIRAEPRAAVINELNYPKTAFADIEAEVTDDGFMPPSQARNPLTTMSWVYENDVTVIGRANLTPEEVSWIQMKIDEHCKMFNCRYTFHYVYHENEIDMLNDIIHNYMKPMPCITGWNFMGYDLPYILNRCRLLGIDTSCLSLTGSFTDYKLQSPSTETIKIPTHKLIYDYMEIYAKWDRSVSPKVSNKLDWVSEKVLGTKKVVHQLGFKEMWEQQKKEYVFYNAVDSILVRELDKVLKTASTFLGLANLLKIPALNAFSAVNSLEAVQCDYLYDEGKVMPSRKREDESSDGYEGAFVFEPKPGVYKNVLTLDYASLYPTTMRQFNISPDTYLGKDKSHVRKPDEILCVSGAYYKRNEQGFIPKILTDFYKKRKAFKKEMYIAEQEHAELERIYNERFGGHK